MLLVPAFKGSFEQLSINNNNKKSSEVKINKLLSVRIIHGM